jgi:epoxyqueuosine reductase
MNDLRQRILGRCASLDIPLVGFAPADRWSKAPFNPWVPEAFRPEAIWPETETVIVIGLPVILPILETSPSIWYHELYRTVNTLLDAHGYRIASFLTAEGYPSLWVPRDGYGSIGILKEKPVAFFSHKHAAYLAGLGTFGVNNTLLTREYGPRVRFASIFTSAEIAGGPVMSEPLCTNCMQCVEICPVRAIDGRDYPEGIINKRACAARSEALYKRSASPCGFCIKVCPVGEDRKVWNRKNPEIYDRNNPESEELHKSWNHVRSYGSR